ncbi:glutathione S-transferase 1-like [Hyposmocoma kahamanoa]|uniref:glutathione S-transferase 1-like n=1 Tax=Hyposmocoma kahamanoa TaxID=1477025 RepID=UPI000E6D6E4A|nr:glutathione S-transferase 1-like [Hyposmocoma kahamanoa]
MPIDLYYTPGSPPCRFVMMVGAATNVEFNCIEINLRAKEQYKPEFLEMNPQHLVPTINDHGFVLWESRAISRYIVNKYDHNSKLYPQDPQTRALIDQRLDFDLGTLCPSFSQFFYPSLFSGIEPNKTQIKKLADALSVLNRLLHGLEFAVPGESLTLADLCLATTISNIDAAGIDLRRYPNIESWFALIKVSAPKYREVNEQGLRDFKNLVKEVLKPKKAALIKTVISKVVFAEGSGKKAKLLKKNSKI